MRQFFSYAFFTFCVISFFVGVPRDVHAEVLFSDGFELDNFANWTVANGMWQIVNTTPVYSGAYQSQVVGSSTSESILQKNISTVGFEQVTISYWYKILSSQNLESVDHLYLEWSVDGGMTWDETVLADYSNASTSGAWVFVTHLLPVSVNNRDGFAFRFRAHLSAASNDQVRIDDIILSGVAVIEEMVDVCANIDGIQEFIPSGYHQEGTDCVVDVVDLCSNIDGVQVNLPVGYHLENNQCVVDPPLPVDLCSNIDGFQEVVPPGYHQEGVDCLLDIVDLCSNIDGVQEHIPLGYHLENNQCVIDSPPVMSLGSITVCNIILDARGNATTGITGTTFIIPGIVPSPQTSQGIPVGQIPTTTFVTPLSYNRSVFGTVPDASCVVYKNLELGGYYYGEEIIQGGNSKWKKPKYNDETRWKVEDKYDLFLWSGELFDKKRGNDNRRRVDSDGYIKLTKERPDRTLIIMNVERSR